MGWPRIWRNCTQESWQGGSGSRWLGQRLVLSSRVVPGGKLVCLFSQLPLLISAELSEGPANSRPAPNGDLPACRTGTETSALSKRSDALYT